MCGLTNGHASVLSIAFVIHGDDDRDDHHQDEDDDGGKGGGRRAGDGLPKAPKGTARPIWGPAVCTWILTVLAKVHSKNEERRKQNGSSVFF